MQIMIFGHFLLHIVKKFELIFTMKITMKKAAVIGFPVKHSLSPRLHNYWLDKYKIAGEYTAIEIPPDGLSEFISTMAERSYCGVNVTVPHKEKVIKLLDMVDFSAGLIVAVNTVIVRDNGDLYGINTDAEGFAQNINSHITGKRKAIVLGAGGATRAICYALNGLGFEQIIITNRTHARAEKLAQDFSLSNLTYPPTVKNWESRGEILQDADLLVNATSLGMTGKEPLDIDLSMLPKTALVTDIVYNPLITPLLAQAQARGNPIIDGLGMLLHQAVPAFEAWFGARPEVTDELRNYILQGL